MPAADRQPDLDGVACAPGVPPAMAIKTTELAAVVGADDPIPTEAKAASESAAEGVLTRVPDAAGEVRMQTSEREAARPREESPRCRLRPPQVEDGNARAIDIDGDPARRAVLDSLRDHTARRPRQDEADNQGGSERAATRAHVHRIRGLALDS